jgi:LacI family transcriptional regulator
LCLWRCATTLVAAATGAGVQSSINSLGYACHRAAANLPFYSELAAGIDDVLDQAGWVAFVAHSAESPVRQGRFIAGMREHRVEGILLAPAEGPAAEVVADLKRRGIPVVQNVASCRQAERRLGQRRFQARHDARG